MGLDVTIPPLVAGLIDQFGVKMVFRRRVDRTYSPATGTVNDAQQAFSCKGLFGTIRKKISGERNESITTVTISAREQFTPRVGDFIDCDGKRHTVLTVESTYAQGAKAIHVLGVTL